jgi:hypothetical protein
MFFLLHLGWSTCHSFQKKIEKQLNKTSPDLFFYPKTFFCLFSTENTLKIVINLSTISKNNKKNPKNHNQLEIKKTRPSLDLFFQGLSRQTNT